jgi:hypothetical protein
VPKMRGIKPEIWTDEKFVELSPHARLLFVGMWHYACDNGHLDDKPKQIKMRVLPTDSVDAAELVEEMVGLDMVERGDGGLTIPKLRDHQRIDNRYFTWCDRCALDEIPEPSRSKHPLAQRAHNVNTAGTRGDSEGSRMKEGRKVKEGEGELVEFERPAGSSRKKASTKIPVDWQPTDEHKTRCTQEGIDLSTQVARFKAHAEANDRRQVNWNAAFTQWLLNVPEWQRGAASGPDRTPFPSDGTQAEKDAWARAQPAPADGAYYGGSAR